MNQTNKKDIRAVVFDMDGLMFDTESVCLRAHKEAGEILNIDNASGLYFQSLAMTYDNMKKYYSDVLNDTGLAVKFVDMISEISMEIYENEPLRIKPGLFELLEFLLNNHYPIAIASSAPEHEISHHLKEAQISGCFNHIISGADLDHGKPAPDIYLKAAKVLNIPAEKILVLEDSLFGIQSAYAAGTLPVMIPDLVEPDDNAKNKAYAIVKDLNEVIPLLKSNTQG